MSALGQKETESSGISLCSLGQKPTSGNSCGAMQRWVSALRAHPFSIRVAKLKCVCVIRLLIELIVPAVDISHGFCKCVAIGSFESCNLDSNNRIALGVHTFRMGANATCIANMIGEIGSRFARRSPAIMDLIAATAFQPELSGGSEGKPGTAFAAK
jgi:hypothetical protein